MVGPGLRGCEGSEREPEGVTPPIAKVVLHDGTFTARIDQRLNHMEMSHVRKLPTHHQTFKPVQNA
jgi:hypothetical protein